MHWKPGGDKKGEVGPIELEARRGEKQGGPPEEGIEKKKKVSC